MDDQATQAHRDERDEDVFNESEAPAARAPGGTRSEPPPTPTSPAPPAVEKQRESHALRRFGARTLKMLATLAVLAGAAVAAIVIWDYYVLAPWTRDGRIRVQVANIVPQVSGQITEVRIVDNQFVHKGDVLYIIDRFNYQNTLDQANAQVQTTAADYQVKRAEAERRQHLSNLATTPEQQQVYVGQATMAEASFRSARAQQAMAEINLDRTSVQSPVNGFITNFTLRVGDYAQEGMTNLSIIDADSYWVDGYFEETKMAHVCVGDHAEAQLLGYRQPLLGVIQTVTRGIAVSNAATGTQGLPSVDPIYTWVRLAQRVPVRMRITDVPPGVPLVSGMTATVSVTDPALEAQGPWWQQRLNALGTRLTDLYSKPPARPGCVPALGPDQGQTVAIPTPRPTPARSPSEINPGLAPGITQSPNPKNAPALRPDQIDPGPGPGLTQSPAPKASPPD